MPSNTVLSREIHCLSTLLSILSPSLGSAKAHPSRGGSINTVDDLLVHIVTLFNTGSVNNLVVALSGSPANIFNMTLTVMTEEFKGMVSYHSTQPDRYLTVS